MYFLRYFKYLRFQRHYSKWLLSNSKILETFLKRNHVGICASSGEGQLTLSYLTALRCVEKGGSAIILGADESFTFKTIKDISKMIVDARITKPENLVDKIQSIFSDGGLCYLQTYDLNGSQPMSWGSAIDAVRRAFEANKPKRNVIVFFFGMKYACAEAGVREKISELLYKTFGSSVHCCLVATTATQDFHNMGIELLISLSNPYRESFSNGPIF